ncbi:MAG: class A beta-lactamase-related serine hydrolase [Acidaminococcaceae bacterium]|jgi:beta-lactamase class A|nr:class A beta-lactamase-related serine hydrolase [Acidaminococcaceae bacterium]
MSINKKLFVILAVLIVLAATSYVYITHSSKYKTQKIQDDTGSTVSIAPNTSLPYTYLNNIIAQSGAGCSVYYKSLTSGDIFYNYSGKMPAAGMIRPFIMAKAMDEVEQGNMQLEQKFKITADNRAVGSSVLDKKKNMEEVTLKEIIEAMIVNNDNTATNILIDILDTDSINTYIEQHGYLDTVLASKLGMEDKKSEEKTGSAGKIRDKKNYTSVNDLMTFFNRLYYNQCVSTSADRFMLETLKKHADRSRLLALLPKTVQAAHETGDAPGVQNDGGIIYAKENYILVILTDRSVNKGQTLKTINQISSIIYNTVMDREVFKK